MISFLGQISWASQNRLFSSNPEDGLESPNEGRLESGRGKAIISQEALRREEDVKFEAIS